MNDTKAAVIIVSYNTKASVRNCIQSALNQVDLPRDEVIVVDNDSGDGSSAMVRTEFPQVKLLVSDKNRGFSHACNRGFRESSADTILFANGDIAFPPGSIGGMVRKLSEDPRIGVLSPLLVSADGHISQMTWAWDISLFGEMRQMLLSPRRVAKWRLARAVVSRLQREERNVPIVVGACTCIRRELLEKVNGFDENFELYFEDADLCLRCRQQGYMVRFTPSIRVHHGLGESGKLAPEKIALVYRQSQIYFYRKHHGALERLALKGYLTLKYLANRKAWTDRTFRRRVEDILRERRRIALSEPL